MSEFKIEKNIPPPIRNHRTKDYPFRQMEIGDSFLVSKIQIQNVRMACAQFKKRNPEFDFMTRCEADTVRIWRVAPTNGLHKTPETAIS